jgi:hypothetical protein
MDDPIPRNGTFYFWCGLIGILATGLMVGMGGDNYWGLANFGSLDASTPSAKGQALMFSLAVFAVLLDLIAIGVVVAGGVVGVQRLRGRE